MPRMDEFTNEKGEKEAHWGYRLIAQDEGIGLYMVYYIGGKAESYGGPIILGESPQEILRVLDTMREDILKYEHDILSIFDISKGTYKESIDK